MTSIVQQDPLSCVRSLPNLLSFINLSLISVEDNVTSRAKMPVVNNVNNVTSRTMTVLGSYLRAKAPIGLYKIYDLLFNVTMSTEIHYQRKNSVDFNRLNFNITTQCYFSSPAPCTDVLTPLSTDTAKYILQSFGNFHTKDAYRIDHYNLDLLVASLEANRFNASILTDEQYEKLTLSMANVYLAHDKLVLDFVDVPFTDDAAFYNLTNDFGNLVAGDEQLAINSMIDLPYRTVESHNDLKNKYIRLSYKSNLYFHQSTILTSDDFDIFQKNIITSNSVQMANGFPRTILSHMTALNNASTEASKCDFILSVVSDDKRMHFIFSSKPRTSLEDLSFGFSISVTSLVYKSLFLDKNLLKKGLDYLSNPLASLLLEKVENG